MAGHYRLFREVHQCPVCNRPLRMEEGQSKVCPIGHIRFTLKKTTQRWYLMVSVPKSRIRINEIGKTFDTCIEAAKFIGGTPSAVNECLHGKRKQHKGYTFEFADDEWQEDEPKREAPFVIYEAG